MHMIGIIYNTYLSFKKVLFGDRCCCRSRPAVMSRDTLSSLRGWVWVGGWCMHWIFRDQSIGHHAAATTPSMCQLNLICTDDAEQEIHRSETMLVVSRTHTHTTVYCSIIIYGRVASQYWTVTLLIKRWLTRCGGGPLLNVI